MDRRAFMIAVVGVISSGVCGQSEREIVVDIRGKGDALTIDEGVALLGKPPKRILYNNRGSVSIFG